jgi:hypothetical protein
MNDNDTTFSITLDEDYLNDSGSEYTFNTDTTITVGEHVDGITLNQYPKYSDIISSYIDPTRVEAMCEHYPALKKSWDNFYSIYKMVDQDYKGNHEKEEEIPF